jgi:hypothetical protein
MNSEKFENNIGKVINVPYGRWDERFAVDVETLHDIDALDMFDVWNCDDYEQFKTYLESKVKSET